MNIQPLNFCGSKSPKFIVLSGFKGSGKDTVANLVVSKARDAGYIAHHIAFADGIRETVKTVFGIDPDIRSEKEKANPFWSKAFGQDFSPRDALIRTGECLRGEFGKNLWNVVTMRTIQNHIDLASINPDNDISKMIFVISDMRFNREHHLFVDMTKSGADVQHWLILRKECLPEWAKMGLNPSVNWERNIILNDFQPDPSEYEWCSRKTKYKKVIKNDGNIMQLGDVVSKALEGIIVRNK